MNRRGALLAELGGVALVGCAQADTSQQSPQPRVVSTDMQVAFRASTEALPTYFLNRADYRKSGRWFRLGNESPLTNQGYAYRNVPGAGPSGPLYVDFQFDTDSFGVEPSPYSNSFEPKKLAELPDLAKTLGKPNDKTRWFIGELTLFHLSSKDGLRAQKLLVENSLENKDPFKSFEGYITFNRSWEINRQGVPVPTYEGKEKTLDILTNYGTGIAGYLFEQRADIPDILSLTYP